MIVSPPPPPLLRVGGTYQTAVTLTQDGCGGRTVANNPTVVTHVAGTTTLTLTHAGNAYQGTVQSNGSFATTPKLLTGVGETLNLSMSGTFTTTGFDAAVVVDVTLTGGATCRYTVRWVGTKDGMPNVIPG